MNSSELNTNLKHMVTVAYYAAKKAYSLISCVPLTNRKEFAAVFFANKVISRIYSAESFYLTYIDLLEHQHFEQLSHQLEVFADEILKCYADDHSYQWVSIEFEGLKELYENSVYAS